MRWHDLSRLSFKSKLETIHIYAQQTQVFETEIKNVLDFLHIYVWLYTMKTAHYAYL